MNNEGPKILKCFRKHIFSGQLIVTEIYAKNSDYSTGSRNWTDMTKWAIK